MQATGLPHAIVDCRECITGRHLLEKTLASCIDALDASSSTGYDATQFTRCENVSALAVQLQILLEGREKFIFVLDGIDKQREASPMLLAALARFGEIVRMLNRQDHEILADWFRYPASPLSSSSQLRSLISYIRLAYLICTSHHTRATSLSEYSNWIRPISLHASSERRITTHHKR